MIRLIATLIHLKEDQICTFLSKILISIRTKELTCRRSAVWAWRSWIEGFNFLKPLKPIPCTQIVTIWRHTHLRNLSTISSTKTTKTNLKNSNNFIKLIRMYRSKSTFMNKNRWSCWTESSGAIMPPIFNFKDLAICQN